MHIGRTETAIVTGKPVILGGSEGRREATGRGVMICVREAAAHLGVNLAKATVALQGFGNVGSVSADLIHELGGRIVAVTDWKGGVYNKAGLDVEKLIDWTAKHKTVDAFPGGDSLTNEELYALPVDILIPAALENQITADNAGSIQAKIVAEGANGPTTPEANKMLYERGVFVIPDILANSGGVTGSYFEWVQNRHGFYWTEEEVVRRLEGKMVEAFHAVLKTSIKYKTDLRTAAYIEAIDRVATVTRMRGMYA
jgi:glutamate dehydrogenase/leucine dehydrogenase